MEIARIIHAAFITLYVETAGKLTHKEWNKGQNTHFGSTQILKK